MAITRRSLFGIPPQPTQGSTNTTRMVPLTQGVHLDQPWPLQAPGSSASMCNLLPIDGALVPRSRLSSLNTIRVLAGYYGIAERLSAVGGTPEIWLSGTTRHAMLNSTGSISLSSFVSAFGMGTPPINGGSTWQYAPVYLANLGSSGDFGLAAVSSSIESTLVLYRTTGSGGAVVHSYLTSAPRALAIGAFDSYLIAMNVSEGAQLPQRVRWCVRGNPSNWTGEGSGFEDLLEMRGEGVAIRSTPAGRFLLFSTKEIWQGIGATYPAQFQFSLLDHVGCYAPLTIAGAPEGYFFVGSDGALRLIPDGGGPSQIITRGPSNFLRQNTQTTAWAVFDQRTRIYHLFVTVGANYRGLVINVDSGEVGYADYGTGATEVPQRGLAVIQQPNIVSNAGNEGLYFANSIGTVWSTNSLLSSDTHGSVVTATWRSAPIAPELAGNYKQLTRVALDYRATSKSTVTFKISQDGGNNYEATGVMMSLASAPVAGRVEKDVYAGGAFPAMELTSQSTGFELHRLDVAMTIGGRK